MPSILIIDVEEQVRRMLGEMFRRAGYDVRAACDGREGCAMCRAQRPDLVITDLIMPDQEGIETIIALRKDYPDLKILAISGGGKSDPEDYLDLAQSLGADRTLAKPFARHEILRVASDLIGA